MTNNTFLSSEGFLAQRPSPPPPLMIINFNSQFDETEVVNNFDIATLRIYIENYIGWVKDWQMLRKSCAKFQEKKTTLNCNYETSNDDLRMC